MPQVSPSEMGSMSEALMPPRKAELALYFLPKHHVLHEVIYNSKKKD